MDAQYIPLITYAGVASALCALIMGTRDLFLNRGELAVRRELRQLPQLAEPDRKAGPVERFDAWFARTLYMSGLRLGPLEGVLLIVLVCLAVGGGAFILTDDVVAVSVAAAVALVLTLLAIVVSARRRLQRFQEQFPGALDLLARAVRAGESLDQALALVGEATADPVGPEFQRCAKQLEMGLSVAACMKALSRRLALMDVRIFCNTLAVHRQAGGSLPITLERLAEVIRDRMSYHRQLKSVTGAGRFSAMLISIVGPILFVYLFVFQPQYGGKLLEDPMGRTMLVVAVVSQLIAFVWIARLLKTDY